MIVEIRDPADPRIAPYVGIRDRDYAREGLFVVEGTRALEQLATSRWPTCSLLLLPERATDHIVALAAGAPVYVAGRDVFDRIAGFHAHRGVLAIGARLPPPDDLLAGVDLAVAVEGVNDHENLGSIFRNAAAFGAGAVVLDQSSCDPLYRRSIRVSLGHVLKVPFGRVQSFSSLADAGFSVLALDPESEGTLEQLDIRPPLAVLVGSEHPGLSQEALSAATHRARIPMAPGVDSLNVATALAVALYRLTA